VPHYFQRKVIWIRLLAASLLVLLAPIVLLLMLCVRMTSPGPALFRQKRLGQYGREFSLLKLRTMYQDAEAVSGPALCQPGDSRITPFGRLLRSLHLDELPQLWNVVRGQMCLVGPRPERPEIIALNQLRELVPGFELRTQVLPGVTGLAQINLPPDVDAASVIPKVELDLEYIETASWGLDLRILLCTGLRMLGVRHGLAVGWLKLGRHVEVGREVRSLPDSAAAAVGHPTSSPSNNGAQHVAYQTLLGVGSSTNGHHAQLLAEMEEADSEGRNGFGWEADTLIGAPAPISASKPR